MEPQTAQSSATNKYSLGLLIYGGFVFAIWAFPPIAAPLRSLYKGAVIAAGIAESAGQSAAKTFDAIAPDMSKIPTPGDKVAGYRITSEFLPCTKPDQSDCRKTHPVTGAKAVPHWGVDVATPVGVVLYAPGIPGSKTKITCTHNAIAGTTATIQIAETQYRALHLSKCANGEYLPGQIFGRTGDTGRVTGPHLHYERKDDDSIKSPTIADLHQVLTGERYNPPIRRN